jgi:hypothetical protein
MNQKSSSSNEEDILLILEELSDVKATLKQAAQQMLRIERRVKAALPKSASPNSTARVARVRLNDASAGAVIESLKEMLANGQDIERKLFDYSVKPDLQSIARALGMTNAKLPPKDDLVRRIAARLRQGVSVSAGLALRGSE